MERWCHKMDRGNVLVIGNSGVGKSTLINAVLGEDRVETGWGITGTTKELSIQESEGLPFRLIDTIGFEPSLLKRSKAIRAVKKWSEDSAKYGHEDNQINVIWFCVEGTSSKLFLKTINDLSKATSFWKSVPVIVVITKSYSVPEREKNIAMVKDAFAKEKRYAKNLPKVIPVVASTFILNDTAYAAPEGITELIDTTNDLMPVGIKAGAEDIASFKLKRKRAFSHSLVGGSTTAAVVVGAVPIPFADTLILTPIEIAMINSLALIYGINKNEESKRLFNSIIEVGAINTAAKTALSALKAIPGLNLGAGILNAIVAGSIVFALGGGTIYAFEQVYLGKKSVSDIDWVQKVIESKFSSQFIDTVQAIANRITDKTDKDTIVKIITEAFENYFKTSVNKY